MKRPRLKRPLWTCLPLLSLLAACTLPFPPPAAAPGIPPGATAAPPAAPTAPPAQPIATRTPLQPAPVETPTPQPAPPTPSAVPAASGQPRLLPEEAILILSPGSGARLASPLRVSGVAGPTFEQALVVRVVSADGRELAIAPARIEAELGQRGPFAVDLAVTVTENTPAFIQVYAASPRDGGLTHLAAAIVILQPEGGAELRPVASHLEQLVVDRPAPGETVRGGMVRVEGFGWASFEQTLIVEVIGPDGALAGRSALIVNSSEMGEPGPFSADVPYTLAAPGPGRIVVRDPSAAFEGDVHLTSVEVNLEP